MHHAHIHREPRHRFCQHVHKIALIMPHLPYTSRLGCIMACHRVRGLKVPSISDKRITSYNYRIYVSPHFRTNHGPHNFARHSITSSARTRTLRRCTRTNGEAVFATGRGAIVVRDATGATGRAVIAKEAMLTDI